jgi:hypothetical protein
MALRSSTVSTQGSKTSLWLPSFSPCFMTEVTDWRLGERGRYWEKWELLEAWHVISTAHFAFSALWLEIYERKTLSVVTGIWSLRSSGIWHRISGWLIPDVSRHRSGPSSRVACPMKNASFFIGHSILEDENTTRQNSKRVLNFSFANVSLLLKCSALKHRTCFVNTLNVVVLILL